MASSESLLPSGSTNSSNSSTYYQKFDAVATAHTISDGERSGAVGGWVGTATGSSTASNMDGGSYGATACSAYEYQPQLKAGHRPFCAGGSGLDCCDGCGGVLPPWRCGAEMPSLPLVGPGLVLVQKQGRFMLSTETRVRSESNAEGHSSSFSLLPNRHSSGNGEQLLVYERIGATW